MAVLSRSLRFSSLECVGKRVSKPFWRFAGDSTFGQIHSAIADEGQLADSPRLGFFGEYECNRALRKGDWKLVWSSNGPWELYNMASNRTERSNLADQRPRMVDNMQRLWESWARRTVVQFQTSFNCYQNHPTPRQKPEGVPVVWPNFRVSCQELFPFAVKKRDSVWERFAVFFSCQRKFRLP